MPEIGEIISGKYRIIDRLGSGAMGVVFLAVHIDTEKQVALKWLNPAISSIPSSAERFRREARATGRIHHPNVVAVHDCGEHAGQLYMVMEHLKGRTLRAHLNDAPNNRLPLTDALALLIPVMRGLSAAHEVGVLHRDMKPENVLLCESPDGLPPVPKVLDFGLAKVRSEAGFATKLSMAGAILGTFQYMAPELLRPETEPDERIDVYSLGAMLYELLSGLPPYHADNAVDLVLQIHAGEAPEISTLVATLPAEVSPVLARALARERDERFRDVASFAAALEPFTGERLRRAAAEGGLPPSASTKPALPMRATELFELKLLPEAVRKKLAAPRQQVSRRGWLRVALALGFAMLNPGAMEHRPSARAADNVVTTPAAASGNPDPAQPKPAVIEQPTVEDEAPSDWASAPPAPSPDNPRTSRAEPYDSVDPPARATEPETSDRPVRLRRRAHTTYDAQIRTDPTPPTASPGIGGAAPRPETTKRRANATEAPLTRDQF
ncbi:MAG: protein kinase [Polyangiales bacterium]